MSLPSLTQELLQPFSPGAGAKLLSRTTVRMTSRTCRVWKNCRRISKLEGGDRRILCAAVLLRRRRGGKNSPQRHLASRMAAQRATDADPTGMGAGGIAAVAHAIEAQFSAGIPRKRWRRGSCRTPIVSTPLA